MDHKPTRVVIRRLPPNITQELLLQKLQPLPEFNHCYVAQTKLGNGSKLSRAYINFNCHRDLIEFIQNFHSTSGWKIEIATNQRVRSGRPLRRDPRAGTIEEDKTYKTFLLERNCQQKYRGLYDFQAKDVRENHRLTPLLKFVLERKLRRGANKARDDCVVFINSAKRKHHRNCKNGRN